MKTVNGLVALRRSCWTVALCFTLLLTACGGGGGGVGDAPVLPPVDGGVGDPPPAVASKTWLAAQLLQGPEGIAGGARVVMDAAGNAIAVWSQERGTSTVTDIWFRRYEPTAGWSEAQLLDTEDGYADSPQVAMNANGKGVAVWQQSNAAQISA
jgi:hypothetical protein